MSKYPGGDTMRGAVLTSGGKDSTYSAWWATLQGWEVVSMITVGVSGGDSMMFQLPNTAIAGMHAASMGVTWLPVITQGEEDLEVLDLEQAIAGKVSTNRAFEEIWPNSFDIPDGMAIQDGLLDVDGIVTGALRSDYQKTRIERMCERLGIRSFSPLWHKDSANHMSSLIEHGFEVIITSVSCEGLDEKWLGTKLDLVALKKLEKLAKENRFNLDGEGGEFETLVTDAPHFSKRVLVEGKSSWNGSRGEWHAEKCRLES